MYLAEACSSLLLCYIDTAYPPDQFRKIVTTMYSKTVDVNAALFDLVLLKKVGTEGGESYAVNNKLGCDAYTVFKLHNPALYRVGNVFTVTKADKYLHSNEVIHVKPMYLVEACKKLLVCYLDSGKPPVGFRQAVTDEHGHVVDVNTALFDFVLLKKLKPDQYNAYQPILSF